MVVVLGLVEREGFTLLVYDLTTAPIGVLCCFHHLQNHAYAIFTDSNQK